jgi:riboflavin biosynthesis pyrimidine reductase
LKTTIICIETLCGRIAPAGFGSGKDRNFLEKIREATDVTLSGAGSLRAGDPEFRISGGMIPDRRIRALITGSGNIPRNRSIFR